MAPAATAGKTFIAVTDFLDGVYVEGKLLCFDCAAELKEQEEQTQK
nr:hypothetical protein [Planococcus glaciei]